MAPRILMIVTSNAEMGDSGKTTGLWAEELAVPYYALTDAGAQVTLASPAGGPAPIDPRSLKPAGENEPVVERLLADSIPDAQARQRAIEAPCHAWAHAFDPYSLVVLDLDLLDLTRTQQLALSQPQLSQLSTS